MFIVVVCYLLCVVISCYSKIHSNIILQSAKELVGAKYHNCVWCPFLWFVNSDICVSGDLGYKPYVTSEPDVTAVSLDGTEDFLVLACDGLWDFVTEEEAVVAVYEQIAEAPGRDTSHVKWFGEQFCSFYPEH